MIPLITYALLLGAVLTLAGRAAESLGRSLAYPVRWVWLGVMALCAGLALSVPLRHASTSATPMTFDALDRLHALVVQPSVAAQHRTTPTFVLALGAAWLISSIAIVLTMWLVARRMRLERSAWPIVDVAGNYVRVSPSLGPLAAGVLRPEIVVPRWILDRRPDEQRLVVTHEAEHIRAHDPALLAAGCVLVAAMPWNPAIWYMLSRLRLAVELDCDARVLRRGAPAVSYGALLIDVAEHASRLRLGALALADDTSHLHQRILAMGQQRIRTPFARRAVYGIVAGIALVAACAVEPPTAADVAQADALTATKLARDLALSTGRDTSVRYVVDGQPVTAEQARAISREAIGTVDVRKASDGTVIEIRTLQRKHSLDTAYATVPDHAPLVFIDGVKSTMAALQALDRKTIENVEVIKGRAVAAEYPNEPDAADGVIRVTTKK